MLHCSETHSHYATTQCNSYIHCTYIEIKSTSDVSKNIFVNVSKNKYKKKIKISRYNSILGAQN